MGKHSISNLTREMEKAMEHLASLINSTQRQNAELLDKVNAVDQKCDLADEANVRLCTIPF